MVRIERASAEDAERLRQIGIQALAADTERYGAGPAGIDSVESHREWMEDYHYYKIVIGDDIIGGMILMPGDDCYHLGALFITPALQNQGIGTRAIEFMEEAYPDAKKWALCTPYRNDRIHRFYERLGYKKIGQTKPGDHPEIPDERFYLLLYEKRVVEQPEGPIELLARYKGTR